MKLQIGDRVAIYGGVPHVETSLKGEKATVSTAKYPEDVPENHVWVKFDKPFPDGCSEYYVHVKQVRKLIKKTPRYLWVAEQEDGSFYGLEETESEAKNYEQYRCVEKITKFKEVCVVFNRGKK